MANDRDEIEGLAAEFVLGTLDPVERRAAEARLASDAAFRAAVGAWSDRLQPLADTAVPVAPHGETLAHVMAAIETDGRGRMAPAGDPANDNIVALRRSVRRWQFVSGLAAAAAIVLGVFVTMDRTSAPQTEFVAMLTPDGGAPAFVLTVDTAASTVSIRRVAEEAPADGRSYELWAVEPGQPAKSLGVVDQVSYTRELPYSPDGLVFAISDEPQGGSPTGVATGPIVYSGPLVPAE